MKFEPIAYASHYGGRCRGCADENGVCPTSGLPCDPDERLKAAAHCLKAWQYGIEHGHMDSPFPPPPAPNAVTAGQGVEAFNRIVVARKKHVDAVAVYNARREYLHSLPFEARFNLDAEYRAMSDAQSEFIRTAQDVADAALATPTPKEESNACAICGGRHDNDVLTDICTSCEARINEEGSP